MYEAPAPDVRPLTHGLGGAELLSSAELAASVGPATSLVPHRRGVAGVAAGAFSDSASPSSSASASSNSDSSSWVRLVSAPCSSCSMLEVSPPDACAAWSSLIICTRQDARSRYALSLLPSRSSSSLSAARLLASLVCTILFMVETVRSILRRDAASRSALSSNSSGMSRLFIECISRYMAIWFPLLMSRLRWPAISDFSSISSFSERRRSSRCMLFCFSSSYRFSRMRSFFSSI
mmetsp:Transcript_12648/g.31499  ORF Transcript_12648/g.31499 Transcript_12648/m.31499 type:complete len:235 (-) Transcript_12648:141-845(-)